MRLRDGLLDNQTGKRCVNAYCTKLVINWREQTSKARTLAYVMIPQKNFDPLVVDNDLRKNS